MITKLKEKIEGIGEVKGITFTKVLEQDGFYIYERSDGSYEVFKIKTTPICLDFDNRIYSDSEFKEVYPKSKDFGITAWSVRTIDDAINKINTKQSIVN